MSGHDAPDLLSLHNVANMTDLELLHEYASSRSEDAFAAVVKRYAGLVHSAALRQIKDRQIAEEITQSVFVILAHKAGRLHKKSILSGWLVRTTYYVAANARRKDFRRFQAEQHMADSYTNETDSAWKGIAPLLDEALIRLGKSDRNALSLRFFEGKSFKEIAQAMGTSPGAAQKRVSRALELIRSDFRRRGLTVPSALIVGALATHAVQAVPSELVSTVGHAVILAFGPSGGIPELARVTLETARTAWRRTMILRTGAGALFIVTALVAYHASISKIQFSGAPSISVVASPTTVNTPTIGGSAVAGPPKSALGNRGVRESPSAAVFGVVVDAETQQGIPAFEVWVGFDTPAPGPPGVNAVVNWEPTPQTAGRDGRFSLPLNMPSPRNAISYNLEVRAEGYRTAQSKVPAPLVTGGSFNFALERALMIAGIVLAPDGTPAEGAIVIVSAANSAACMPAPGQFDVARSRGHHAVTDETGHFVAQADPGTNTILVAHAAGYFEAPLGKLTDLSTINLHPWGRVEGTLRLGSRPGASETILLGNSLRQLTPYSLSLFLSTNAGSTGNFSFYNVPPGQWEISRLLHGSPLQKVVATTQRTQIEVRAGEKTFVTMGGTGWRVVGQIRALEQTASIDWRREFEIALTRKYPASGNPTQYAGLPDATGAFAIEDVPPGIYELAVQPFPPDPLRTPIVSGLPQPLKREITLPDANSGIESESFDLGVLDLTSRK